jgi:hypothetical protein
MLGSHDLGNQRVRYEPKLNAVLPGGNCVFRRTLLQRIGPYSREFGHVGGRPLGNDDTELYHRILDDGACGFYLPRMLIYHNIPSTKITKAYARKLSFWGGVAMGQLDRIRRPRVRRVAGIPTYMMGNIARQFPSLTNKVVRAQFHECFQYELALLTFAGFVYGRRRRHPPLTT